MQTRYVGAASVALMAATGLANAGPDWVEILDAGSVVDTAQPISILTQLQSVTGTLNSTGFLDPDLEDCYLFDITSPSTFLITTSGLEVELSIFRLIRDEAQELQAYGVLSNNNGPAAAQLTQFSTDFTEAFISEPGTYMLSISLEGRAPVSNFGNIFNIATPTEISGPDGPGGDFQLVGWTGTSSANGQYTMTLEGVSGTRVPAPGPAVLLACGALAASRRKRR
jgi:hypothetical protein